MSKDGFKVVDLNRRKAIRERCLNCSCWIPKEVTHCTFKDCPLYPFRTGKGKQNPKKRKEAVWKYCLWCQAGQHSEVIKGVSVHCPLYTYRLKQIDRTLEIDSNAENERIGTFSEAEIKKAISMYG